MIWDLKKMESKPKRKPGRKIKTPEQIQEIEIRNTEKEKKAKRRIESKGNWNGWIFR